MKGGSTIDADAEVPAELYVYMRIYLVEMYVFLLVSINISKDIQLCRFSVEGNTCNIVIYLRNDQLATRLFISKVNIVVFFHRFLTTTLASPGSDRLWRKSPRSW